MGKEIKIGLFATFVIIVMAWFIITISNYQIKKRNYKVLVDFSYVGGLDSGTPVRLSGVKIGSVAKVYIHDAHPRVLMEIQRGIRINKEALIYINSLGIIGEAYVEITIGDPSAGYHEENAKGLILTGRDAVSMGDLIFNLNDFSLKLGKFEETIMLINESLDGLNKGMDKAFAQIDRLVKPLEGSTDDIVDMISNAKSMLSKFNKLLDNPNIDDAIDNLNIAGKKFNLVMDETLPAIEKLNKGEGTLGKLLNDDKLHKRLTSLSEELETALAKGKELQFWWYGDLVSDRALSAFDGNLNFEFYPAKNRFYSFGISKIGSGDAKLNATLNVVLNRFVISAGITEETPAIGLGYNFTERSRLRLETFHWDQGFNALNLRISFRQYIKWAGINLTFDDLIHSPAVKFGLSIRFREEDFKYLFGITM
ncbi:MCE family protein [bacterium]|nr:MCE family protein [bacterium]